MTDDHRARAAARAAELRAEADELVRTAEREAAVLRAAADVIERSPDPRSVSDTLTARRRAVTVAGSSMIETSHARRTPGPAPRGDHPLTRALAAQTPPVPLAEWCRARGLRRDAVTHAIAGRRPPTPEIARAALDDLGVPLAAWAKPPQS